MPDTNRSRAWIESSIARAHRQVWNAAQEATASGRDGLASDLESILTELERLQNDQLRHGGVLRTRRS